MPFLNTRGYERTLTALAVIIAVFLSNTQGKSGNNYISGKLVDFETRGADHPVIHFNSQNLVRNMFVFCWVLQQALQIHKNKHFFTGSRPCIINYDILVLQS